MCRASLPAMPRPATPPPHSGAETAPEHWIVQLHLERLAVTHCRDRAMHGNRAAIHRAARRHRPAVIEALPQHLGRKQTTHRAVLVRRPLAIARNQPRTHLDRIPVIRNVRVKPRVVAERFRAHLLRHRYAVRFDLTIRMIGADGHERAGRAVDQHAFDLAARACAEHADRGRLRQQRGRHAISRAWSTAARRRAPRVRRYGPGLRPDRGRPAGDHDARDLGVDGGRRTFPGMTLNDRVGIRLSV